MPPNLCVVYNRRRKRHGTLHSLPIECGQPFYLEFLHVVPCKITIAALVGTTISSAAVCNPINVYKVNVVVVSAAILSCSREKLLTVTQAGRSNVTANIMGLDITISYYC